MPQAARIYAVTSGHRLIFSLHTPMISGGRTCLRPNRGPPRDLAYSSDIAGIGLTIPAVAIAAIWHEGPLLLGLGPTHQVPLFSSIVVGTWTVIPGYATLWRGCLHLVLFTAYLALAVSPRRRPW
ncbi:hypothetical protein [Streptomyces sp. 3N207]|uniref:hypothetical protein n=1 Tax=Streptomyces sp. 3N207 TaxID=3457417 RepID=UPI003FCF2540